MKWSKEFYLALQGFQPIRNQLIWRIFPLFLSILDELSFHRLLTLMTILAIITVTIYKYNIPTAFWAAAACNALAFTWIGFPSGLITVTVLPNIEISKIAQISLIPSITSYFQPKGEIYLSTINYVTSESINCNKTFDIIDNSGSFFISMWY